VQEAVFKTFGCGSAIASSSFTTEWLKGKDLKRAGEIKNSIIAQHLKLPPRHDGDLVKQAVGLELGHKRPDRLSSDGAHDASREPSGTQNDEEAD